jgi:hypothetical protein
VRYAIDVAPLGPLAEPSAVAELAAAAETAGWDGISIWDSLGTSIGADAADPFITLAAAAARTSGCRSSPRSSLCRDVARSSSPSRSRRSTDGVADV